jgi:hypothetical protein
MVEIITIIALVVGPILAVQVQEYLGVRRIRRERRHSVFRDLMATRGLDRISPEHVRALNRIDIEFYDDDEIITAWKKYLTHLGGELPVNQEERNDLFVDLLMKMAKKLGYIFDINHLKRDFYTPQAHGDLLTDQLRFRKAILDILEGRQSLGVHNVILPTSKEAQENLLSSLMRVLNGEQAIQVNQQITSKDHNTADMLK